MEKSFSKQLSNSQCVLSMTLPSKYVEDREFALDLRERGFFFLLSKENELTNIGIAVNHSQTDAFGMIRYCSQYLHLKEKIETKVNIPLNKMFPGVNFKTFVTEGILRYRGNLAQVLCSQLFSRKDFSSKIVGIPVSYMRTNEIKPLSVNFVTVLFKGEDLLVLSQKPMREWYQVLSKKSNQLMSIALKGRAFKEVYPDLLLSFLGDLTPYPWSRGFTFPSIEMAPTPTHYKTTNIVIWSNGNRQNLSTATYQSSQQEIQFIASTWEELFCGTK